jgi:hypothetical protein
MRTAAELKQFIDNNYYNKTPLPISDEIVTRWISNDDADPNATRYWVKYRKNILVDLNTLIGIVVGSEYGSIPNDSNAPGCVLDLGGYVGGFSVLASLECTRPIITVEPVSENIGMIQRNMEGRAKSSDVLIKAALGDSGEAIIQCANKMVLNENYSIDPSYFIGELVPLSEGVHAKDLCTNIVTEKVPVLDLAELLTIVEMSTGSRDVFFAKIDAEGAEYPLFQNAKPEDIRKIKYITGEFHYSKETLDNIFLPLGYVDVIPYDIHNTFAYRRID